MLEYQVFFLNNVPRCGKSGLPALVTTPAAPCCGGAPEKGGDPFFFRGFCKRIVENWLEFGEHAVGKVR